MKPRSVERDGRRRVASPRSCCARFALISLLLLAVTPRATLAQPAVANEPQPAEAAADGPAGSPRRGSTENTSTRSATKEAVDLATALERRGSLNLHGLSLNDTLFMIGEQWGINVVAGDLQGKVNGVFNDAPLREILDSILLSNGYNYRAVGKSLVISSVAELGQVNPFFRSATIPVRAADIDEVVEGAKLLSTPQGQVRALKSANSIVVLDFPDRVNMIRQFVAAIEGATNGRFASPDGTTGLPLEVGFFRTQHITARSAELVIQTILSKDGRVGVMEKEDRLLVTDYAENLAMVEKVLMQIDHPRPQVRITALIYDISLQDIEQLGLKWNKIGYLSDGQSSTDFAWGSEPFTGLDLTEGAITSLAAGTGNIGVGTLNRHFDINAVVQLLQRASDARLLAKPSVAVLENEQAIFKSVSEIPFQQLTQTQQGGNIGTTSFKEAGITLTVTPKIACNGTIAMLVSPEFSRLAGFTPGDNQPIIDTRKATTTLTVANRQTVVIGGLLERRDVGDFSGIPYLKDIKGLGRLFRSRDTDVRESELVVFISPEIISYADDPTLRQQMAADTIRCRLDQIPEAEGCPPCCRRLPPGACVGAPEGIELDPNTDADVMPMDEDGPTIERLPPPQPYELPPMSADQVPSAALQFGSAGRYAQRRALVSDNRLRRLPQVEPAVATAASESAVSALFGGPPQPPASTAESPAATRRR